MGLVKTVAALAFTVLITIDEGAPQLQPIPAKPSSNVANEAEDALTIETEYKMSADNFRPSEPPTTNEPVLEDSSRLSTDNIRSCLHLVSNKVADNVETKELKTNLGNSDNEYQLLGPLSVDKILNSNSKSKIEEQLYAKYIKMTNQLN